MATRAPNIIVLMADHMRFDCLDCYGDRQIRTPHLDALAEQAVIFDRMYCSTPLCVPTRTSMVTGKWPHTQRVIVNGGSYPAEIPFRTLGPEHRTIYEHFAGAGWDITHVGVQHVHSAPPLTQRVPSARINPFPDHPEFLKSKGYAYPANEAVRRPSAEFNDGRPVSKMYHSPMHVERTKFGADLFTDCYWAERMVEEIAGTDTARPHLWFFELWAPHPPFFVPEPYFSMYDPAQIAFPPNMTAWHEGMPGTLLHGSGARGAQFQAEDWRRTWAAYFGLVSLVDDCMGKVINAFKAKGIWDDALALFTMDHGEHLGCHSMFQKFTMYEESARLPLLVKPPRTSSGSGDKARRTQPVGHIDLAPTFCDYAGLPALPGMWGSSLRPLVDSAEAPWREATFSEFNGDHGRGYPTRAMMTGRWKYVCHFGAPDELYDLQMDPYEMRSLAREPAQQGRVSSMRGQLGQWMRETDDVLDMERDRDFHPGRWRALSKERGWVS